ncbi:uncharacterized protein BYT42DRAFT_578566 [Radiomyces spectabilis]|uniref:uncharacterized protein n=1 Tax=Radiomyces spectabilis TaxID=64574 RepID=UPI00221E9C23|nr:uncharacterized protein BYT42DRAFT_578566 [Radiomyces spectabilis]KAI8372921.1 hypothetical protein BYT42DRAFT_578566 [Radiomyces spectabilis]
MPLEQFSLKGKTALVTGGGRGLGLNMSKALADAGANVAVTYVSNAKTVEIAEDIAKQYGVKCKAYKVEVADADDVKRSFEQVYKDFGAIDIFVANAGISIGGSAETFDLDSWRRLFDVNVHGVFYSVQAVSKYMLEKGKGSIILISSISGAVANMPHHQAGYNSTKGAVSLMAKCLAYEWAQRGVRVNTINPGYMKTDMIEENTAVQEKWKEYTPMGRLGEANELNGAVVYLASDASSYVTGSELFVDGGYTAV